MPSARMAGPREGQAYLLSMSAPGSVCALLMRPSSVPTVQTFSVPYDFSVFAFC